jgi:hypothetical protein
VPDLCVAVAAGGGQGSLYLTGERLTGGNSLAVERDIELGLARGGVQAVPELLAPLLCRLDRGIHIVELLELPARVRINPLVPHDDLDRLVRGDFLAIEQRRHIDPLAARQLLGDGSLG